MLIEVTQSSAPAAPPLGLQARLQQQPIVRLRRPSPLLLPSGFPWLPRLGPPWGRRGEGSGSLLLTPHSRGEGAEADDTSGLPQCP